MKDCILEARKKTIVALLEACSKLVKSYESDHMLCQGVPESWGGISPDTKRECDTLVYECLIKGLKTLGLWPGNISPSDVHKSLTQLTKELRSMTYFALESNGRTTHDKCGFQNKLRKQIDSIVVPSGIDDPLRKHMKEQAKK